jgi:hypothetical protein
MEQRYNTLTLEAIARKTLKEYDPALLFGEPCAVPIEKIARWLGLDIEYQCLRKNGAILGEMVYDDTYVPMYFRDRKQYELVLVPGKTIILDESLLRCRDDGRLRFTCAHEIAHYLRHKTIYAGTGQTAALVDTKKSSEENPVIERQADILATALLIPSAQVKKAFHGIRNIPDPAAALAELFDVSKQAMGIFMREHSLV